jgi:hypothetical protein
MTAPRVVLHVGLPKTGTSFVQEMLRTHADVLASHGVRLPAGQPQALFTAVLHLTDRAAAWGRDDAAGRRAWEKIVSRAARGGTTVVSSETLCLADDDQVARILDDLDGVEVDVVVSARDLARQVPAEWQEGVKHGRRVAYPAFLRTVLDEQPGERQAARTRFWRAQDPVAVLDRWAKQVGSDRVHLVVAPPPGAPREELWRRFARVLGPEVAALDLPLPEATTNTSLGRAQVEVLRRVNQRIDRSSDVRGYGDVVKRLYAGRILRGQGGDRVRLPDERLERARAIAEGWCRDVTERGYDVAGDLADLVPRSAAPDDEPVEAGAPPAPELLDAALDATAELLGEVQRLRQENARLRGEQP